MHARHQAQSFPVGVRPLFAFTLPGWPESDISVESSAGWYFERIREYVRTRFSGAPQVRLATHSLLRSF